jgi:methylglutaconyl-CoA hydratase
MGAEVGNSAVMNLAGGIATITLNRPAVHNALDPAMVEEIVEHLQRSALDEGVRVVVLAASGNSFCAGGDFNWVLSWKDKAAPEVWASAHLLVELVEALTNFQKPTVARVQGAALGGGLGLALACDFLVASASAKLGVPSVKSGLVAAIAVAGLVDAIGIRRTRQMLLTGKVYCAEDAAAMGLVDIVAPDDEIDRVVSDLCKDLAKGAPQAQRISKAIVAERKETELTASAAVVTSFVAESGISQEALEGMAALLAKRKPSWQNSNS